MPEPVAQRCFHCQKNRPYESMIPGEMLRPAIIETIKKRDTSWSPSRMICVDCLDLFRSEYVEDALKDEVGELSKLEQEVVDSLREQENLTENINRAFERSITFGQHVADGIATFGGSWIFIGAFFGPGGMDRHQQRCHHPHRFRSLSVYTVEFDFVLPRCYSGTDHHDESKPHRGQRPAAIGK